MRVILRLLSESDSETLSESDSVTLSESDSETLSESDSVTLSESDSVTLSESDSDKSDFNSSLLSGVLHLGACLGTKNFKLILL